MWDSGKNQEEGTPMPQMIETDKKVTLCDQLQHEVGLVILINTLTIEPEEAGQLLGHGRQP